MDKISSLIKVLLTRIGKAEADISTINTTLTSLTNDSMADTLHRHSELSASDGTPNPALQVDASGNVGIGTTNPSASLDVRTSTQAEGIISIVNKSSGSVYGIDVLASGAATTNYGAYLDAYGATDNYALYTARGNVNLAATSGNVGIGLATAPAAKLDVSAGVSPSAGIKISADTNNLVFANSSRTAKWYQYLSGNDLRFYDTADRVTIQSGGNVGIGTTGPAELLDVEKNQNGTTAIRLANTDTGTSARAGLSITNAAGAFGTGGSLIVGGTGYTGISYWQDSFVLNSATGLSGGLKIRAASGGIGFSTTGGTTASDVTFDSSGNVTTTGTLITLDSAGSATFRLDRGATTDYSTLDFRTAGGTADWQIYTANTSSPNLIFYSNGAARMFLTSAGKLNLSSLPTSSSGLSAGDVWNNSGVLNIV